MWAPSRSGIEGPLQRLQDAAETRHLAAQRGPAPRPAKQTTLDQCEERRGDLLRAPRATRVVPLVNPVQHPEQTEHDEARRHVAEDAALHAKDDERLDALVVAVLLRRQGARQTGRKIGLLA